MKESKEEIKEITELELNEGNLIGTGDVFFQKFGDSVPLHPNFDSEDPPAQAIAISDRFGIVFAAHNEGFCVVKIKEIAELAKKVKETKEVLFIKDSSILDVSIGKVYILALSSDSSTLAASIGGTLHLFAVASLLNKEERPFSSSSLNESEYVRDFQWRKSLETSYILLSSCGVLYHGDLENSVKDVVDNVDAVDWSVKGDFIAIARKNTLSLLSSQFREQFRISLPFQQDTDSNCGMKVDSIKWVRDDSIILGCIQLTDDGEVDGYVVHVITSKECGIVEDSSNPMVLSFDFFASVSESILPSGCGPYLFVSYLGLWELAVVANRKNIDDHIVMLSWLVDNKKMEPTALDIIQDKWLPRIELQDNGDDNLIVGFGIGSTSIGEKFEIIIDESAKELSPYRVLLCLTIDGKLSLLRVARISEALVPPIVEVDASASRTKEPTVDEITLDAQSSEVITEAQKDMGVQLQKDNALQASKLNKLLTPHITPDLVVSRSTDKSNSSFPFFISHKEIKSSESSHTSKVVGELDVHSARQVRGADSQELEHLGMQNPNLEIFEPSGFHSVSSGSQSSGRQSNSKDFIARSSSSAFGGSVQGGQSGGGKLVSSRKENFSTSPIYSAFASDGSVLTGGKKNATIGAGNAEIASIHSFSSSFQESSVSGRSASYKGDPKLDNQRSRQYSRVLNSEVDFSKDFGNVREMADELDSLLFSIEKVSGLRDANSVFKKLVLALEEGLMGLSKECREKKVEMETHLGEVQNLLDKTMQMSARRIHMESIVKQFSCSQYWDLWNRQRLNPEFELKHCNILKANQNLTNHLIELERHFNAIELNKFGEIGGISKGRRTFQNSLEPSRQIHCLHSLYNTTSSQLAVAEELSECLSKQMALMNVATLSLKQHNVAKELFDSIGLVHSSDSFQSPGVKDVGHTPDSIKKLPYTSSFSASKENSVRKMSDAVKGLETETARRRRDSLDRSWVSFEPQKTTMKRMLQERSKLSASKSHFEKTDTVFKSRMIEEMGRASPSLLKDQQQTNKYSASRDVQSKHLQQNPESSPTSFFKWSKYSSGPLETMGLKSNGMQAASSTVQDKTTEASGFGLRSSLAAANFGYGQSDPYRTEEGSVSEAQSAYKLETSRAPQTAKISSTILSSNSDLPNKAVNMKAQPNTFTNFKIDENIQTRPMTGSSGHSAASPATSFPVPKSSNSSAFPSVSATPPSLHMYVSAPAFTPPVSLPTISSIGPIFGAKPNTEANPIFSSPISSVLSSPSPFPSAKIQVSSSPPFLEPKSQTPPPTPSSPPEKPSLQVSSSPPKPHLEKSSATPEPALPPTPTNEVSTGSVFSNPTLLSPPTTLNLFGTTLSSSSSPPDMEPAAPVLSSGPLSTSSVINGNNEDSEDEMEEEAPDPTTEISLGALGGFGLGSTIEPSAPKPNPFGVSLPAVANQGSSLFSMATPSGELFRPASFSLPSAQPSQPSQPANPGLFSGGFGSGIVAKPPTASGFGQPVQIGVGQQALGSVLGSFGQSRQLGMGLSGAGLASSSGFVSGGFGNIASGGVFPGTASGGGFAAAATGGGGFSAAAAAAGGGGGFAGVASGGGGFQAFSNKQEGNAVAFGGANATGMGNPPSNLFTQMRK